jgi:hypothetical protein
MFHSTKISLLYSFTCFVRSKTKQKKKEFKLTFSIFVPSLPSPMAMRPSRSHESLSPAGQNKTSFDLESDFAARLRMANGSASATGENTDILDTLCRLNLTSNPTPQQQQQQQAAASKKPADLASKILTAKRISQPTNAVLQHVHNSLFNDESCFELRSLTNSIAIVSVQSRTSDDLNNLPHISPTAHMVSQDAAENGDNAFDANTELMDENDVVATTTPSQARKPREKVNSTSSNTSTGGGKLLNYQSTQEVFSARFFMCRSSEERDKWLQCMRNVMQPQLQHRRHEENALQVWILEAKGQAISGKPNKRYLCEIYLNSLMYAKTSLKDKKDILFWGENFDFR